MKRDKAYVMNRKDYEKVRKMNHCQMTLWAESIYTSGYKDGANASDRTSLTVEEVGETLRSVKGLGDKRISDICDALNSSLDRKEKECKGGV